MLYCTVTFDTLLRMASVTSGAHSSEQRSMTMFDSEPPMSGLMVSPSPSAGLAIWSPGRRRSWVTITLLAAITML